MAGAPSDSDYRQKLATAGFDSIDIEETRVYKVEDAREFLNAAGIDAEATAPKVPEVHQRLRTRTKTRDGQGVL